jgi:glycine hydroxymethyltransferase
LILCRAEHAAAIDAALAPGLQAAPGGHIIAARAALFGLVARPEFRVLMRRVVEGAQALAEGLSAAGVALYAGGTGTHMVVAEVPGADIALNAALFRHGIVANTTTLPRRMGLRLGSTPMAIRGLDVPGFRVLGLGLGRFLLGGAEDAGFAAEMAALARLYPVPSGLE